MDSITLNLNHVTPGRSALSSASSRINGILDTVPPAFTVTSPAAAEETVYNKNFTIKGTRENGAGIKVNETTITAPGSSSGTSWSYPVTLSEGNNSFNCQLLRFCGK